MVTRLPARLRLLSNWPIGYPIVSMIRSMSRPGSLAAKRKLIIFIAS